MGVEVRVLSGAQNTKSQNMFWLFVFWQPREGEKARAGAPRPRGDARAGLSGEKF